MEKVGRCVYQLVYPSDNKIEKNNGKIIVNGLTLKELSEGILSSFGPVQKYLQIKKTRT